MNKKYNRSQHNLTHMMKGFSDISKKAFGIFKQQIESNPSVWEYNGEDTESISIDYVHELFVLTISQAKNTSEGIHLNNCAGLALPALCL